MNKKITLLLLFMVLVVSCSSVVSDFSDDNNLIYNVDVEIINLVVDDNATSPDYGAVLEVKQTINIDNLGSNLKDEKILIQVSDKTYLESKRLKDLYNNGNAITFIGENLDHKALTNLMDLPLELVYEEEIYAITFKQNQIDSTPIISIVRKEAFLSEKRLNKMLVQSIAEIDEIEVMNQEMSTQSAQGVLISTLIDNKTFDVFGEVRLVQRIYQDPTPHTNFNYYTVSNQARTTPGIKKYRNNCHNYWLRQEIEYGNPDEGIIEVYDFVPKRDYSNANHLTLNLPLEFQSTFISIPFQAKSSWVNEAVDRSWMNPRHVYWATNFAPNQWDSREQYTSEVAALIINTRGHRLRVISRYNVRYKNGFTYRDGESGVGVVLWP